MLHKLSQQLCFLQAFEAFPDNGAFMVFLSACSCEVFERDVQILIRVGLSERETVCVCVSERDRESARVRGRESVCHFPLVSMATSTSTRWSSRGFFPQMVDGHVTKFATNEALKFIACCRLTFDEE